MNHDDDFGPAGRSPGLVWGRSITTLLVVGGLSLIFLAGYALHGHTDTSTAAPRPSRTPTTVPAFSTPSASATPPPHVGTGRAPHLTTAGTILGYSHDQAGAIAAAGNDVTALYVHTNRTPGRERAVLASMAATPADATRMAADFASEDAALARMLAIPNLQATGTIAFGHPTGYRISDYTPDQATIDVHVIGGQGTADAAAESFAEVDRLQLTWSRGDWRLSNWSRLVDGGPALGSIAAQNYAPFPIGETGDQP